MVFYFSISEGNVVYMGRDKFENEELIKYAWDEDIWFHVDDFSSAHVYLRLKDNETLDTIPESILQKMAQLTKHNSIEGSKKHAVNIVYTPASNLKKTESMDTGTVSFHNSKLRRYMKKVEKDKEIVKAMIKTQREENPDLEKLKNDHIRELQKIQNQKIKEQKQKEEQIEKEKQQKQRELDKCRKDWDDESDSDDYNADDFI